MRTILIIEDEKPVADMLRLSLMKENYNSREAYSAREAEEVLTEIRPDLIMVDWMLPDMSGPELVKKLRRNELYREIPMLMLTARAEEEDVIHGLDHGVDDYMTKPVSLKELHARIRSLLRRSGGYKEGNILIRGPIKMDLSTHQVLINDQTVEMGITEFKLLKFFLEHPERVYSRSQMLDFVWQHNAFIEERTVDVHILRLRKVLKAYGVDNLVQTVRGVGYRFTLEGFEE